MLRTPRWSLPLGRAGLSGSLKPWVLSTFEAFSKERPFTVLPAGRPRRGQVMGVMPYLPFLIVFLPSNGSSTGSTVSPMFSMSKMSPSEMACSMMSR